MKAINSITIRIILSLVIGVVLIVCSSSAINYLVITIGILFIIPGLISILEYFVRNNQSSEKRFPIESIGSSFLGLALILAPGFFVGALMYIIAGVLILAGILQMRELFIIRNRVEIPVGFYITPAIVLIIGAVILFNPFTVIATTFMILGIACVIYSLSELVNYLKFLKSSN